MKRIVQISLIALVVIGGITVANRRKAIQQQEQERLARVKETRQKILEKGVPSVFPKGASQTEGWLSVVGWDKVQSGLHLSDDQMQTLKKLTYDVIIPREKEHADDYFAFYHGQMRKFWVFYELQKQLYEAIHGKTLTDFYFLRNLPIFKQTSKVVQEWLVEKGDINDWTMRRQLYSTNLAFPGNLDTGESAVDYYFESRSNVPPLFNLLLNELIESLIPMDGLSERQRQIIERGVQGVADIALELEGAGEQGMLVSIFVPNYLVDSCVYMSKVLGHRVDEGYYLGDNLPSEVILALIYEPNLINNIEFLQARFRLNEAVFGDPRSGIKMFLNHNIPEDRIEEYKKRIAEVVQQLLDAPGEEV